jgi:AcrR family transcriptional regulator
VIEARPLSSAPTSPDTRERLLRSAIQVFAEHGYAGGTIRDICRRAQANLASVHYYFGDKQGLYAAIFEQVSGLFRQRRARYLPAAAPAEARLRVYIQAALEEILGGKGERATAPTSAPSTWRRWPTPPRPWIGSSPSTSNPATMNS